MHWSNIERFNIIGILLIVRISLFGVKSPSTLDSDLYFVPHAVLRPNLLSEVLVRLYLFYGFIR